MAKSLHFPLFTGFNYTAQQDALLTRLARWERCSRAEVIRRLIEQAGAQLPPADEEAPDVDGHGSCGRCAHTPLARSPRAEKSARGLA